MMLGQFKRAEVELRQGLASAERAGLLPLASLARHNLGPTLLHNGDREGAERFEREAIRDYDAQENKRLRGASRFYLGRILIAQGRFDEAEQQMRLACADGETIPAIKPLMVAGLSRALLAGGKNDEALALAKEAMALLAQREGAVEEPMSIKLFYVEALLATGQSREAAKLLSELSVAILEQASHLRDPELRRTFLNEVEDHARTFTLQKGLAQTE
jgi:ATP/maltotriose-dependent transcriptional regulator MalT